MLKTVEFFDLIKQIRNLPSDYALAKLLGVTPASISKHRRQSFGMSNELAIKCAEILGYDPAYVLICANFERANCTAEKMAFGRLGGLALAHSRELTAMR